MQTNKHIVMSPAILYWGTPVVLITSQNEDGTNNIAPMSSAWWVGHSCMLGLDAESKTTQNILRTGECVLNLPDESMAGNYSYVKDKWARSGLSPSKSDLVSPDCVAECPVQMECQLIQSNHLLRDLPDRSGLVLAIEVRVLRVHVLENLRMPGYPNRVDPDQWRPLIMSFQEFYGLRNGKVTESVLGRVSEEKYRGLTKSDVKKLPGDDDDSLATAEYSDTKT
ncbi:putative flavin reductase domain protein fmn-binding protein [Eutypa lata UCREL1]|uniref:Putative flavin reductase domain protein fmn-binding protein n=1 Tax=Eutypa lata (strain UCR-EL1) TaxID=1287681 RepID=M7SVB8_EUTLA|nr:putative flavin reductase domain protein fmn-binding protein [Eutypa lata UCREL1]